MYSARHLNVSLDGTPVLSDLQFEIEAGSYTGIVGPNGSGKTTLLRALSGATAYEGELTLKGEDVRRWDRKRLARNVAVLQQASAVFFDFDVADFILLGRLPHKGWLERDDASDRALVEGILNDLELGAFASRTLPSLSGGERQRVFLAQALAQQTDILLLDEPTTHLDVYHQFDLLTRTRQLVDRGKTVIAVFHDLSMALRFSDRVLVLQDGRLAASGPTQGTLTQSLIREVFRMDAQILKAPETPGHVHFLNAIPHEDLHQNR